MSDVMSGLFGMLQTWNLGGVSIMIWIVAFCLLAIVGIFVKGNR